MSFKTLSSGTFILWVKLKLKVSRKVHILDFSDNFVQNIVKFSQKNLHNLWPKIFEDSLASENEPKMDLQTKIFEALLQHWYEQGYKASF